MIRTQIYITEEQRSCLNLLSQSQGKKQSELIGEAIDNLIAQANRKKGEYSKKDGRNMERSI